MSRFPPHPERRPAVVTGASSGIGEATARALASAGHPVVLGARRVERCEAVAAAIRDDGGEAVATHLDVSDRASIKEFIGVAADAYGAVDVVVSNAGDTQIGTAVETDPETFAAQVQVNLVGAHELVAAFAAGMVERRRGDVVFVSSESVRLPRPRIAAYAASKWAIEGLARSMQTELEGTGVRVSLVRPGPTMTEMGRDWDPGRFAAMVDDWVRWGVARHAGFLRPDDVAGAILAVVSIPRGAHVTLIEIEPEAPIEGGDQP